MCGAFSVIHPFRDLSDRFNAGYNEKETKPRYNVRPSQPIATILNSDPEEIVYTMWGIHPFYDKTGKMFFINARNDSMEKPTWRKMISEQRCLILADGFYEWQKKEGVKTKTPFRFELKTKEPFAFAGLWQMEKDEKGNDVPHSVIITTEPNELVSEVHNRMPAILTPESEKEWLNPDTDSDAAIELLRPFPKTKMTAYAISPLVNLPSNDTAEIIKPAENSK
jgi:putative SOS response-associated peptidase YedK